MRLAVIGRSIPTARKLIRDVMDHWRPEHLIVVGGRTGLAGFAHQIATELGIPITMFRRDDRALGNQSLEVAADQAVVVGKPDLLLAVATGKEDHRVITIFRRHRVKVVVGNCELYGKVEFAAV